MTGLANMVLFLLLTNYIAALVAVQLLRGDLPEDTDMNYSQISLSFLGMYQAGFFALNRKIILTKLSGIDILVRELDNYLVQRDRIRSRVPTGGYPRDIFVWMVFVCQL